MNRNKFWLASNSPRRREILTWADWQLETTSSNGDETMLENEAPEQYVRRVAELKSRVDLSNASESDIIISADTIVVFDGKILGKPKDLPGCVRDAACHARQGTLGDDRHRSTAGGPE